MITTTFTQLFVLLFISVTLAAAVNIQPLTVGRDETYKLAHYTYRSNSDSACKLGNCGGYMIKRVNTDDKEIRIQNFLFRDIHRFNVSDVTQAISTADDANAPVFVIQGILRETHESYDLQVVNIFRMLPTTGESDALFFTVHKEEQYLTFTELNTHNQVKASLIYSVSLPLIDRQWYDNLLLEEENVEHKMVVQTSFNEQQARLERSFINVPSTTYQCRENVIQGMCQGPNQVSVYRRSLDRCLEWDGCVVKSGPCSLTVPSCPTGYHKMTYAAKPRGCQEVVCDADFLTTQPIHKL
eukprot:gene11004-12825_t